GVELNSGGWTAAPHLKLSEMLTSGVARDDLLGAFKEAGLELIALNANGNQLHPTTGEGHSRSLYDTVTLAGMLGVKTVCCMSGLTAAGPSDRTPNWVVSSWPPETQDILRWQWNERLLPYWRELVKHASDSGLERFAIELHGNQLVYNVPTLLRM